MKTLLTVSIIRSSQSSLSVTKNTVNCRVTFEIFVQLLH